MFQSLQGTIQTGRPPEGEGGRTGVSIPSRYDPNYKSTRSRGFILYSFQSLQGTIQTQGIDYDVIPGTPFQSLQGTIQTAGVREKIGARALEFQSLQGTIQT